MEVIKQNVQEVLSSRFGGIGLDRICEEYQHFIDKPLPFRGLGYSNVQAFLRSIPDVARMEYSVAEGQMKVYAVAGSSSVPGGQNHSRPGLLPQQSVIPKKEVGTITTGPGSRQVSLPGEESDLVPDHRGVYTLCFPSWQKPTELVGSLVDMFGLAGKVYEIEETGRWIYVCYSDVSSVRRALKMFTHLGLKVATEAAVVNRTLGHCGADRRQPDTATRRLHPYRGVKKRKREMNRGQRQKVYVGNLNPTVRYTFDMFRKLFHDFPVSWVSLKQYAVKEGGPVDNMFAFIVLATREDAERLVKTFDGYVWYGRSLKLGLKEKCQDVQISEIHPELNHTMPHMSFGPHSGMPGLEPSMPGLEPSMPGLEPGMPGLEPSMPGLEPSMPGLEFGMPGLEPSMPGLEPILPSLEPIRPGLEPMRPPLEPIRPPLEPIRPPLEPIRPPLEPIRPALEPIRPPLEPIRPALEPIRPPLEPNRPPLEPIRPPLEPIRPPLEPIYPPLEPILPPLEWAPSMWGCSDSASLATEPLDNLQIQRNFEVPTVIVTNIRDDVNEADLSSLFAVYNPKTIRVISTLYGRLYRKKAYIELGSVEDVKHAVNNLDQSQHKGFKIKVDVPFNMPHLRQTVLGSDKLNATGGGSVTLSEVLEMRGTILIILRTYDMVVKLGQHLEAFITTVISDKVFWGQILHPGAREHQEKLSTMLNASRQINVASGPGRCLARFQGGDTWYRAWVMKSSSSVPAHCRVFYLDYGNTAEIPWTHTTKALDQELWALPPLAVPFTLINGVHNLREREQTNITVQVNAVGTIEEGKMIVAMAKSLVPDVKNTLTGIVRTVIM